MITLDIEAGVNRDIRQWMEAFGTLQKNIRNKYLKSSMRSTLTPFKSVLRKNTPPEGVRRGRRAKGARNTGNLKRSVTVVTRAKKDRVTGVLGYKAGDESRKALWLEFGTKRGIKPRNIIDRTMAEIRPRVAQALPAAMARAFENALKDKIPKGAGRYRGG